MNSRTPQMKTWTILGGDRIVKVSLIVCPGLKTASLSGLLPSSQKHAGPRILSPLDLLSKNGLVSGNLEA
jgi:hypothetical protein